MSVLPGILSREKLRSSSDQEKIIRLSSRTMASESRRIRQAHSQLAPACEHHTGRRRPIASFAAAQQPRRLGVKRTSPPVRHATWFMSMRPADLPVGRLLTGVSSLFFLIFRKILVPSDPKSHLELSPSRPTEGRIAIVTDVGMGCGGRGSVLRATGLQGGLAKACERSPSERTRDVAAYGEVACPDAPTLASSLRSRVGPTGLDKTYPQVMVANKPGSPGRARRKPLKPFACGNVG